MVNTLKLLCLEVVVAAVVDIVVVVVVTIAVVVFVVVVVAVAVVVAVTVNHFTPLEFQFYMWKDLALVFFTS